MNRLGQQKVLAHNLGLFDRPVSTKQQPTSRVPDAIQSIQLIQ